MASWAEFEAAAPEVAGEGKRLFYQFGVGLGFMATVRKDGGPRLHPVCPVIAADGLYVFVVPSPKRNDLRRDGRYALHSYPPVDVDDEFCVTGRAAEVQDPGLRAEVVDAYLDEVAEGWSLFALDIERCLHAKYRRRGDSGRRPTRSGPIWRWTQFEKGRDSPRLTTLLRPIDPPHALRELGFRIASFRYADRSLGAPVCQERCSAYLPDLSSRSLRQPSIRSLISASAPLSLGS